MKKINCLLCFLVCIFIFPFIVRAEDIEYTLFDSNITVNKDRTVSVKEEYKVYFINDVDKISRKLDKNITLTRPDNSKVLMNTKLSAITSDSKITKNKKNNMEIVTIKTKGKQDETNDFNLNYQYNLGKDSAKNYDELYYDIASNLDAPISNLTFTVTLPSSIKKENIKFAIDDKFNLTEDDIIYEVNDNVVTGTLNKLLNKNQKLSLYFTFPNNYFVGATDNFNYFMYIILIFPIIGIIVIAYFWFKYALGNKLRIKRSAEVPNNFDSAEIGYLYKGKLDEQDLSSLVVYLATKGYLKFLENDDGYKLGKENSFKFVKLQDYDKNNAAQELIFEELFRNREVTNLSDIEYHFADTFKEAGGMLNNEDNKSKMFYNNMKLIKLISLIFIVISVIVMNFNSIYLFTGKYWTIIPMTLLILLGIYIFFVSNAKGIVKFILGGAILAFSLYVGIVPVLVQTQLLIIYLIGTTLTILMCILYTKLTERTKFGTKVLGDTYSLKYYLETITKQELEQKMAENVNYYYDMIPYAYVLDSLDIWIKKGRNIITTAPEWYVPSSEFDLNKFGKFVKNVIYTTTLVMMKQVYSESELVKYSNDKVKTNLNN